MKAKRKSSYAWIKAAVCTLCAAWIAVGLCGCMATQRQTVSDARIRADLQILREDLVRMQGGMEGLDMEYQRMSGEIEALRQSSGNLTEITRRQDQLDRGLAELNTARNRDRDLIIEKLSSQIADLLARSGSGRASSSASGYEHIVQPGETLSEIAAAYKVKVNAIIEANNLANPNMLRQGQQLFIPK